MTARRGGSAPVCSRCGRPQPPAGELRSSDGAPIATSTYLALAGLVGDTLVCADCLSPEDGRGPVDPASGMSRGSPTGVTETLLDEHECRRLLPTQPIGRLAFIEHADPVVVPAHFVVRGPEIVLAVLTDGRVDSARREDIVAFGIDAYDAATRQAWWVSTLGRARLITDPSQTRELDALAFTPWAGHPERNYIAIDVERLRGKRLALTAQPDR